MTALDRASLKAIFETGDEPTGSEYGDLIDSFLSLNETTAQTIQGLVTFAGGVGFAAVSASSVNGTNGNFTTVSGATVVASTLRVSGRTIGHSFGECFIAGTASTTIGVVGTYALAGGTTSAEATNLNDFSHNGSFRLTYTGAATKRFMVDCDFSVMPVSANQTLAVRIAKDGTTLAKTTIEMRCATVSAPHAGSVGCVVALTASSYLELHVTNLSHVANATFKKAVMSVAEIGA